MRASISWLTRRMASSNVAISTRCSVSRKRWCGLRVPTKACSTSARLAFSRPQARSASTLGSVSPANSASRIARAGVPRISVATSPNLRLVSSSVFWSRLTTRARSSTRVLRWRVKSRSSRCAAGGMKLRVRRPCRKRSAIHSAARPSVLRPGTAQDASRMDDQHLKSAFQQGVDWSPIDFGCFHGHLRAACFVQPIA